MPYLLVKQKIVNFDRWYAVFKSEARALNEAGIHDLVILKETSDPNLIVCLFKFDDLDKAKAYTNSLSSQKTVDLSGIIGNPEILFLEKV